MPLLASTAVLRTVLSLSETLEAPGLITHSEAKGIGAWNFSHRIGAGSENHASRPAVLWPLERERSDTKVTVAHGCLSSMNCSLASPKQRWSEITSWVTPFPNTIFSSPITGRSVSAPVLNLLASPFFCYSSSSLFCPSSPFPGSVGLFPNISNLEATSEISCVP